MPFVVPFPQPSFTFEMVVPMSRRECQQPDCPSDAELLAFGRGELDVELAPRVERCVETCRDCLAVLTSCDGATSGFLAGARGLVVSEFCSEEERARAVQIANAAIMGGEVPIASSLGWSVPTRLRDLRLEEQIGAGGMGTIYRAVHEPMDRIVAVKLLPAHRLRSPEAIRRFQKEIRAIGNLSHPHIVQAYDAGEHEGVYFLVTEFVAGADLSQVVYAVGRLRVADACEIIRQAAAGLDHAHQHGLVHRDVKPSNIMLANDGCVKVLDLGLARLLGNEDDEASGMTSAGQVMGTIDYMSPEQSGDSHNVDARTDIYSLGTTLYKLLTGVAPLCDRGYKSLTQKIAALESEQPTPIRELREEIPEALGNVVQEMLHKSPDDRLATANEVVDALQPFATGADLAALAESVQKSETNRIDQTQVSTSRSIPTETGELVRPQPAVRSTLRQTRAFLKFAVGTLLATVILAGIVVIIRDRNGSEKARVNVGEQERVEIISDADPYLESHEKGSNELLKPVTRPVSSDPQELVQRDLLAVSGFAVSFGTELSPVEIDDVGNAIVADNMGNLYVASTKCAANDDREMAVQVDKYSTDGNVVWRYRAGSIGEVSCTEIAVAEDGSVYVVGDFSTTVTFDSANSESRRTSAGTFDFFVLKLDPDGLYESVLTFGQSGEAWDRVTGIAIGPDGNPIITGYFGGTMDFDPDPNNAVMLSASGSRESFVMKLTPGGKLVWAKALSGDHSEGRANEIEDAATDSIGNIYVGGYFVGQVDFDRDASFVDARDLLTARGTWDAFLAKYDSEGTLRWVRQMGASGGSFEAVYGVTTDSDGNSIVTGTFGGGDFDPGDGSILARTNNGFDIFVSKFDPSGGLEWTRQIGGAGDDRGRRVAAGAGGSLHVGGFFNDFVDFDSSADGEAWLRSGDPGFTDAGTGFLLTLDASGDFVSVGRHGGSGRDAVVDVAVDMTGNVYLTGFFENTATFDVGSESIEMRSHGGKDVFATKVVTTVDAALGDVRRVKSMFGRAAIRAFEPRQPLSRMSLVTRPATIDGIKSWTLETMEHRGPVRTVSFSPNGKWLASGGEDGTVRLREPEFGEVQKVLVAHSGVVHSLAWSPDSRYLASIDERCMVCVWDPETGALVRSTEPGRYKERADVVWSADGRQVIFTANLAGGWVDRGIGILDLATQKQETHLPEVRIHAIRRLSDKNIVLLGAHGCHEIYTWTEGSSGIHLVADASSLLRGLSASPDGKLIAATSVGPTHSEPMIHVWEVPTGKSLHSVPFPAFNNVAHMPSQVAFSPDGSQLAVASSISQQVRVLDVRSGAWIEPIGVSGLVAYCLDVAWSLDGTRLAVATDHGLAVCSTESRRCLASFSSGPKSPITRLAWSPNGQGIATAAYESSFNVHLLASEHFRVRTDRHSGLAPEAKWSNDGNMVAFVTRESSVDIWSRESRELIARVSPAAPSETSITWSPDDRYLGVGRSKSLHEVFGDSVVELKEHNGPVKRFEWSPDGRYLMTSEDFGGKTHVWDAADYKHVQSFDAGGGWGVAWSHGGRLVAIANGTPYVQQPMPLFEIGGDTVPKWEFKLGDYLPVPLLFLPSNRHLLVADHCGDRIANYDAASYLVDVNTGNVVHKLKSNGVLAARCAQDGSELSVLDERNVLRSWDVETGRLKTEHQGHVPYSESADWSAETETIASGTDGSVLHLWCARTARPLGACLLCGSKTNLYLSPEGHYQLTGEYQGEFVYVIETEQGQETLTPEQFSERCGWSNDPAKAEFMDADLLAARRVLVRGGEVGIYSSEEPITTFEDLPTTTFDIDRVWLWKNEQVTDRDLQWLPKLKRLRSLSVALTGITDTGMKHVASVKTMRWLHLDSTSVTDHGLLELRDLSELETLSLCGIQVSKASLGVLTCHNLKNLYLRHSTIGDDDLEVLSRFASLERLCIDDTVLTNSGLEHLVGLKELKELDLSGTKITDECLPSLRQFTSLEKLTLKNTAMSDSALSGLRQALPNCSIEQ